MAQDQNIDTLDTAPFSATDLRRAALTFKTPLWLFDEKSLLEQARVLSSIRAPFGFTPRFAMKALPTRAILQVFKRAGLSIDASSIYEARRALAAGFEGSSILLTAQEIGADLSQLVAAGVQFTASSRNQLLHLAAALEARDKDQRFITLRVNPGLGSGHCNRTNVGGPSSSFGIWFEQLEEVIALAQKLGLTINRIHSHIGSGSDPAAWDKACELTLAIVERVPSVSIINLGGGFKVARMSDEKSVDLIKVGEHLGRTLQKFAEERSRKLHLELEPGTFLTAKAGCIVASVIDLVDTGEVGYNFIKLDTGMTELLRPALYGAQHPISIISREPRSDQRSTGQKGAGKKDFVVVGHCCESGDILTPAAGDPEGLLPRALPQPELGDLCVIGATGAYSVGFSARNYNSFPEAVQVLKRCNGRLQVIKKREQFEDITRRERSLEEAASTPDR